LRGVFKEYSGGFMSGIVWPIGVFGVLAVFLIVTIYRAIALARLPVHLRWELAPIPHEKDKMKYGGSYLEDYEWWKKRQHKSRLAPLTYMVVEIFSLRGIWRHNLKLWPLTFAFHTGIYLVFFMLLLGILNAIFIITGVSASVLNVFVTITSVVALAGYLLGGVGAISLILKRILDADLRAFSSASKYFNLGFLAAVFVSGAYSWFVTPDFALNFSQFIKGLVTLDTGVTVSFPLSLHVILASLFFLYLPWTDMIHFVAKYFTYHEIKWNDSPKDARMEKELKDLLAQPVSWSAEHIKADGKKSWADLTKKSNE
jgi:nitrate reductase gamma subunit